MDKTEKLNIVEWDGEKRGWYEVWYFKLNEPGERRALWGRYTILVPYAEHVPPVGEVWGIFFDKGNPAGNLAVKESFPLADVVFSRDRFRVAVGGSEINHEGARGGAGGITWDLKLVPSDMPYVHMPRWAYKSPLPRSKGVAPNLSCRISGTYTAAGVEHRLEDVPAHQSHHWGTKHMWRWAWVNCNCFNERNDAVLEAVSGTYNEIGVETMPFSTLVLRVGTEEHRFHWVKNLASLRSHFNERGWTLRTENGTHELEFTVVSDPADMICVTYMDPDLQRKFCHNNTVADLRLELREKGRGGGRTVHRLTSAAACAYELAAHSAIPGIRVAV